MRSMLHFNLDTNLLLTELLMKYMLSLLFSATHYFLSIPFLPLGVAYICDSRI